jgi:hypothetical protein
MDDEYVKKRVAKLCNNSIYFGPVVERVRGPVIAAASDGTRVLQAVWKIVYDDEDT